MKLSKSYFLTLLHLTLWGVTSLQAQQYDCNYKPPILTIDFGNAYSKDLVNVGDLNNYTYDGGECPQDGFYSFRSSISACFLGNWISLNEDHTPGDVGGKMMIVNAAIEPGTFFRYPVNNVSPNTNYEISVWVIDICTGNIGCEPTPPNLSFLISTGDGIPIRKINTGAIKPVPGGRWLRYHEQFTTPVNTNKIIIELNDETYGGCGNDFAIDDITLRECVLQKPATISIKKPDPLPNQPANSKPLPFKTTAVVQEPFKRDITSFSKEPVQQKNTESKNVIKEIHFNMPVPELISTRSNPVIKTIELPESEMIIELYDNGEIDGDTVTVFHNNELLVANAGLSDKPIRFKIRIDKQHPYHELVMVANNLGSIPPNTCLMIVTANEQRFEIFISSTEEKNAKLLFKLKDP